MFGRSSPRIEFLCAPEDQGVIAEPVPAREALPDWFRRIPAVDKQRLSTTEFIALIAMLWPGARRFLASLALMAIVFAGINVAVLSTRGFGNESFPTRAPGEIAVLAWNTLGDAPGVNRIAELVLAEQADIVLPTHTDEAPLFGDATPEATAQRYLDIGVEEVVAKDGAKPAFVALKSGEKHTVPTPKAEKVVDFPASFSP